MQVSIRVSQNAKPPVIVDLPREAHEYHDLKIVTKVKPCSAPEFSYIKKIKNW